GRTGIGCRTPTAEIDSAREVRLSSSKLARGWFGFGRMLSIGTSSRTISSDPPGMRADRPRPRPVLRAGGDMAADDLLCHLAVGDGSSGRGVEDDHRLAVAGRLRQLDVAGNDVAEHDVAGVVRDRL